MAIDAKQLPQAPGGRMGETSGVIRRFGYQEYTETFTNHQHTPTVLPQHALHDEINNFLKDTFPGINLGLLKKQAK